MGLSRGSYQPVTRGRNDEPVQQALGALTGRHPGWGFWKLRHRLRKNGLVINHQRTVRIYRAPALNLPRWLKKHVLTRLVECHGRPAQLRTDNGPEFISARLPEWCGAQAIALHGIQPGKPTQNACIERFNGSFRRELPDAHPFRSLTHVRQPVDE